MNNVLTRLQEYEKNATAAEKAAVAYILSNPEKAGGLSIHRLAEDTFSSSSTIIRLCHKLGFSGFKDFQNSIIYELAIRHETEIRRMEDIKKDDSLDNTINKVTYKNIISLENTMKLVDMQVLKKSIELLNSCKSICLFGMGASLLVAKDAYLKFMRIHKSCYLCDDIHAQILQAMNMDQDAVAIIISYSGLTEEMITCAQEIKKNGAKIILITRFETSPLSKLADYCLYIASSEYVKRSGAMSSRISQLNMIDILYTAYINLDFDNNMKQLQRTHIKKKEGDDT